ncbi:hypothetical protein [Clostridium sp. CF012]|uniref:hypothetical protein n=1 Tax=Clostridium sp. CF012 TaxID=2843319 RepID=UPI001C0D971F|nr:hypothetical protein [Clostridium sp. CF012]MBU3144121.1 hypothetical protein [Clostridium sp. CF012]
MITKIKFSECLRLLLSALDMSNNRLAKGINVDSSLVSRWLHEQRIPSYNSNHLEAIALFLSKSILNSLQEQRLNEYINTINIDITLNAKDKIMKVLLESQGYSMDSKKKDAIFKKNSTKSVEIINLPDKNSLIIGRKKILSAMLSLIEKSTKVTCKKNNIIYISFNSSSNVIKPYEDFMRWRDVVLKALKHGYTVKFIFDLMDNLKESLIFLNFAKPLLETGTFLIYYYKFYETFNFGREVTIIPGIGALSCLSTSHNSEVYGAFYVKSEVGIDILGDNFNAFLLSSSKPLMKYYTLDKNLAYCDSIVKSEERPGARFLFKDNFNLLTIPNIQHNKLLEKLQVTNDELDIQLELHKSSLNSFLFNLQHYEYFDVYTLGSIQNLIKSKQLAFISNNKVTTIDLETEDIIMFIQNIIDLIKTYDNYKIALINETLYNNENNICSSIIIKEKYQVYIELSKFRISIDEPMLVNAFEEHFKKIWKQISPIDKNKEQIISWLQRQMNVLKK